MIERMLRFMDRRFTVIVLVLTLVWIITNGALTCFVPGGRSILRDKGIISGLAYLLSWAVISYPFIRAICSEKVHGRTFFIFGFPLMVVALVIICCHFEGRSLMGESDAPANFRFIEEYQRHKDRGFMGFYNASSRPAIDLDDPRLVELAEKYDKEKWIAAHWDENIAPNIRAAITPPFFFFLVAWCRSLLSWISGWYFLFSLIFTSGSIVVLWYLVSRHTNIQNTALVVFSFAQFGSFTLYMGRFLNDAPALFFFMLGVLFIDSACRGNAWRWGIPAGFSLGCAILTRLTYAPIFLVLALFVLISHPQGWRIATIISLAAIMVLVVMIRLGYDPVVQLMINIPLVRKLYLTRSGLEGAYLYLWTSVSLSQFFTGFGFGWIIHAIHGWTRPVAKGEAMSFWQSRWGLVAVLILLLVFFFQEPGRNLTAAYPLIMGSGLRHRALLKARRMVAVTIWSGVAVVLSRLVF